MTVSVHIPTCREPPEVVIETIRSLVRLDWPADRLEVIVLDNNTPDPRLWTPVEQECEALNKRVGRPVFRFFHVDGVKGFKAGALNLALERTRPDADVIAVVDADYVLEPDWLTRTLPHFDDPRVGFVQAPQDHRDGAETPFKRFIFNEYSGFFHIGMVQRDLDDAIILHGTMAVIRRRALEGVGGWATWGICEDAELGLRLHAAGWRSVYLPDTLGRGLMPDDWAAYAQQRYRWAYGGLRIVLGHGATFLGRGLTPAQKLRYLGGWAPWMGDALGLVFAVLSVAWTALHFAWSNVIELPPAVMVAPMLGAFAFRLGYTLLTHRLRVPCGRAATGRALIAGTALSTTVGIAVLHAAVTPGMPFKRTPKTAETAPFARRLAGTLRSVRVEAVLAATLGTAAAFVLQLRWWDPGAVLWGFGLLAQGVPPLCAVVMALIGLLRKPQPLPKPVEARTETAASGVEAG